MNAFKVLSIFIASGIFSACVHCLDCNELDLSYRYFNGTSYSVEIVAEDSTGRRVPPSSSLVVGESVIFNGKHNGFLSVRNFREDPSIKVNIRFEADPTRCLKFEGDIQDSLNDPRTPASYYQESIVRFVFPLNDEDVIRAEPCP
jgi:hypothetical protein